MTNENRVSEQGWEKWKKGAYEHITNPDSKTEFNSIDPTLLLDHARVAEMLEVLDAISYGGFGKYAIKVRQCTVETSVVELEVGMGQRSRKIYDPIAISVYGTTEYIPWPDGDLKFELGRKGNRVVTLNLGDLSRAIPDSEIK